MIVKEIIDDIKIRLKDTQEFYKRNWLLYLVDSAVKDIARQTYYWRKEVKIKLDTRYNSLNLPTDFLRLENIKFSSDGNNYQIILPMDKSEERKRSPILNQQTYQDNNWFNWIPVVMPDMDVWGLIKNGNVVGNLDVGKYLKIDLKPGQYLYFEKALSITAQEGWTIEGNIVLPNEISGGSRTEGLTNNIFSITDDKGGVSISLWTLLSYYNKIWLEIDTENETEEIECILDDEIQFKISGSIIGYNITVINKTASKTYSYTLNRTFSDQTAMLTFGGELTGILNPNYPVAIHKGLKWKSLYFAGVNGLNYSNNISLYAIQTKTLIFDHMVRNGWILLDYSYIPAKIKSETDIVDIDDDEIIVCYVLTKIQKGDDLILAREEYLDRLQDIIKDTYQKPFENLWIPGGGY